MKKHQIRILAVATLAQAFAIGVTIGIFPLMLEPLEADFSAPRTQISIGPVLIMLALCSAGVVAGGVLDKGRVRRAMLFGAFLLTFGLVLAGVGPSLGWLAVAALASGFSIPFVGPLAGMTLVTRSFDEEQGRAFGIMSTGPGIGSGIFAGLGGLLLQTLDWREIYLLLAAAIFFVLVPLIWFTIPAYLPALVRRGAPESTGPVVRIGEVLRRPVFWLTAGVFALAAGVGSGWTSHYAAFLGGDVGMGVQPVASLVALQFWMGVPGALFFGVMTDRMPASKLFTTALLLQATIFAAYSFEISALVATALAILFGFATGGMVPLYMALLQTRLEPQILGRAMGISNILMLPAMALTVMTAASVYEADLSYSRATVLFGAGLLGAIGCLFLSNRSAQKT